MKKLILVDELVLGNFTFRGFVLERDDNCFSYSIFLDDHPLPFIDMVANKSLKVVVTFNSALASVINKNKTKDKARRLEIYKDFYQFVIESEKKASYLVFKKKKLHFMRTSRELLQLKKLYISD